MASWDFPAVPSPSTANYAAPLVNFAPLGNLVNDYYKGRQEARAEDQATAFRNGIPRVGNSTDPNAPLDINKTIDIMAKNNPNVAMPLLQLQLQNQYGAQDAAASSAAGAAAHGGMPQGPQVVQGQPQSSQPATPAPSSSGSGNSQPTTLRQVLNAQGIPNDQWDAAAASLARQLGMPDDKAPIDINDPQVRNVLGPAIGQLKRMGLGQVQPPQPGDNAPQQAVAAAPVMTPAQRIAQGTAAAAPQSVANGQADPADPENAARLAAAANKNRAADALQARAIANARVNPNAAQIMQKQVDSLRAEANKDIDAVNADVARTTEQKNAEASGATSPQQATVRAAELKGEVDNSIKAYNGAKAAANQYQTDLKPYLDVTRSILSQPGMYSGVGSGASLAINRVRAAFGDQKAAMLQEALQKITASSVLSQINTQKDQMMEAGGTSGRIFAQQVGLVEKAAPQLATTPSGNRFLINVADRMGQFSTAVADQMNQYIQAHGHLDAKFDQQMSAYLKSHAIFTPQELKHPEYLGAPDAPPDIGNPAHAAQWAHSMGLKVNDPIRLPDGSIKFVNAKFLSGT